MYDTLLDDFEDDGQPQATTRDEPDRAASSSDDDASSGEEPAATTENKTATAVVPDQPPEEKPEEVVAAVVDTNESWSDDPVRMYLTQNGRDPAAHRESRRFAWPRRSRIRADGSELACWNATMSSRLPLR